MTSSIHRCTGLVLAQAEFTTDEAAQSFLPPQAVIAEVTDDARFTGSRLVQARRDDLLAWLSEYGIKLQEPSDLDPATGTDSYLPGNCR